MTKFLYRAKKNLQETVVGVIEATSRESAVDKLTTLGLTPVNVKLQEPLIEPDKTNLPKRKPRITPREILVFTRQLHNLIKSRLPIPTGLRILYEQEANPQFKRLIQDLLNGVKDGQSLSQALNAHPEVFSRIYVGIIASGEAAGRMEEALQQISIYLERIEGMRLRMRQALAYPLLMIVVGLGSIFVLLTFVIPRLAGIFNDFEIVLPLPTRILLGLANFSKTWWWLVALVFILFLPIILKVRPQKDRWNFLSEFKYRIPLVHKLIYKQDLVNFTNALGLLLKSGISLFESLRFSLPIIEERRLRQNMEDIRERISAGNSFSNCLESAQCLPVYIVNMIRIGEESGRLEQIFSDMADFYTQELDSDLKIISSIIEPLIILIFGTVMGFMVMAILLPIFQINVLVR